jgi:hypothetical protein
MPTTVRERVRRHRQLTRATGFVRVDVELPGHLVFALRLENESIQSLMLRALNALKEQMTGHVSGNKPPEQKTSLVTGNKPRHKLLPETPRTPPPVTGNVSGNAQTQFIDLWNQGFETKDIAERLGITYGAAQSRANKLQRRGLIQKRPRGGGYPSRRAQARGAE